MPASSVRMSSARCSGSTRSSGPIWPSAANTPMTGLVDDDWRGLFARLPGPRYGRHRHLHAGALALMSSSTPSGAGNGWPDLPPDLAEKIAWRNGEGDDPAALGKPPNITVARWRLGGAALAAALALVLAAGQAAACDRPQGWTGGTKNRRRAMDGMVAFGTPPPSPVGRPFFPSVFHLCGPAGRPGQGARLDAGPSARHETIGQG